MEIKVIKENKNEIEIEILERDYTIPEMLVQRLNENDSVTFASYKIEHPLVSYPRLLLRVKKGHSAKETLLAVIQSLKEDLEKIAEKVEKK